MANWGFDGRGRSVVGGGVRGDRGRMRDLLSSLIEAFKYLSLHSRRGRYLTLEVKDVCDLMVCLLLVDHFT